MNNLFSSNKPLLSIIGDTEWGTIEAFPLKEGSADFSLKPAITERIHLILNTQPKLHERYVHGLTAAEFSLIQLFAQVRNGFVHRLNIAHGQPTSIYLESSATIS